MESSIPELPIPSATTASEDRKSTRLNSSHVVISYAVFCLKKKKYDGDATVLHYVDFQLPLLTTARVCIEVFITCELVHFFTCYACHGIYFDLSCGSVTLSI